MSQVEGPRLGWNLDGPALAPEAKFRRASTQVQAIVKHAKAMDAAFDGVHPDEEIVILTKATCCSCHRDVVRFVTTTGSITTISEWQHAVGSNLHTIELEF